jgi:hypothetical protein
MKVEVRSFPHLAKNERDVGHPRVRGGDGSQKVTGSRDLQLNGPLPEMFCGRSMFSQDVLY